MDRVSSERLKSLLHYSPESGLFTWKEGTKLSGRTAGCIVSGEYWAIKIDKVRYRAHRLAFLYMTGDWPADQVDHINHIRSDNRWCNLRSADGFINQKNRLMNKNNSSSVTGVAWDKRNKKWQVYIMVNRVQTSLGRTVDFFEACCRRKSAEIRHGYHKNHGVAL